MTGANCVKFSLMLPTMKPWLVSDARRILFRATELESNCAGCKNVLVSRDRFRVGYRRLRMTLARECGDITVAQSGELTTLPKAGVHP
jgi:hypothetical protein